MKLKQITIFLILMIIPVFGWSQSQYIDVLYLKDGRSFTGQIVEQTPAGFVELQTSGGRILLFEEQQVNELAIVLQLELARKRLEDKKAREKEGDTAQAAELEQEIARLKDEIEDLAGEELPPADAQAGGEARSPSEAVSADLQAMIAELMEMTKGMWSERLVEGTDATQAEISQITVGMQQLVKDLAEVSADAGVEKTGTTGAGKDIATIQQEMGDLGKRIRELSRKRQQDDVEAAKQVVETLIRGDGWKEQQNREMLTQLAASLSEEERIALYETNKRKSATAAAGLNVIPLLGLGSWMQGDTFGAITGTALTTMGAFLFVAPLMMNPEDLQGVEEYMRYIAWGGLGAGYAWFLIRPFLFDASENRTLRNTLLPPEKRLPSDRSSEAQQAPESLGFAYTSFNLGGFLLLGPSIDFGLRIAPESTLGVQFGYPALGLLMQLVYYGPGFEPFYYSNLYGGINFSQFFKVRNSRNRIYAGCSLRLFWEYQMYGYDEMFGLMKNDPPDPVWSIEILPCFGYRLRFPSHYFVNIGLYFGLMIGYEEWNQLLGTPDYVNPDGNIELSIGKEFGFPKTR